MKRQWLAQLPELLKQHNIKHIVVSPGSRSAPLILHLANYEGLLLYKQVDERTAAFIALGMAQKLQQTVALVCTSGTALLNYGPALAEAYYQHIPLLVLTADRPPEWTDQGDGQTMRQYDVFHNYIRKSYTLPVEINHPDDEWFINRILAEAIQTTQYPVSGPVHINIPLREPLYQIEENKSEAPAFIETVISKRIIDNESFEKLTPIIDKATKIMILVGLSFPEVISVELLNKLANYPNIVIVSDIVSNVYSKQIICASDDIIAGLKDESQYIPDLLISCGGPVLSKRLKNWIRKHRPKEHWNITETFEICDTFQCLTKIIPSEINYFLQQIFFSLTKTESEYSKCWHSVFTSIRQNGNNFLQKAEFSDFKAAWIISKNIPEFSALHLANSMPVRYAHLISWPENLHIFANRGVSGIDGCVSTAVGYSFQSANFTTIITGDLSMLYDSHALWNNQMPGKIRIIVINNGGGGIFRIIDGPGKHPEKQEFFETPHQLTVNMLAQMHKITYLSANNEVELTDALLHLYCDDDSPKLLEIFTQQEINVNVYKSFYEYILNN